MYEIFETSAARKDKEKLKSMSPAVKKRFENIVVSLSEDPFKEVFGFEELKYNDAPKLYSVELTKKDRVVYSVNDNTITIYQYLGHYNDK